MWNFAFIQYSNENCIAKTILTLCQFPEIDLNHYFYASRFLVTRIWILDQPRPGCLLLITYFSKKSENINFRRKQAVLNARPWTICKLAIDWHANDLSHHDRLENRFVFAESNSKKPNLPKLKYLRAASSAFYINSSHNWLNN